MSSMTSPFKYQKVLVLGAGPEVIGQGSELDGAVWQVCRFLQEEAIKVVLIDSNLTSVATEIPAARTYIEPLTVTNVEQIIAREKPDGIMALWGGRVALNLLVGLAERNVLTKYHLKILGADPAQLAAADQLTGLRELLVADGWKAKPGAVVCSINEGLDLIFKLGLPVALRPIAAIAGAGGSMVYNREEFDDALARAFAFSPVNRVLIEEAWEGWREYELTVLRDEDGQCLTLPALEYLGPVGVHGGDRIKVIPSPSLQAAGLQLVTAAALQLSAHLELVGGANFRFAHHPATNEWVLSNINLHYTMVSALNALVCGCPLVLIWTKLLLGSSLAKLFGPEILASGTVWSPGAGYQGVALPCFAATTQDSAGRPVLGMAMQSVGAVIGLGGCFKEALQKAARALEPERDGLSGGDLGLTVTNLAERDLKVKLVNPDPRSLNDVYFSLQNGFPVAEIVRLSGMPDWLLAELGELLQLERELTTYALYNLPASVLRQAKEWGFSDRYLARLFLTGTEQVRKAREQQGIIPGYRGIGGAGSAGPPLLWFSTYAADNAPQSESLPGIVLVGGGPHQIGGGAEVDYCLVQAIAGIAALGEQWALVDSNPYTLALAAPQCGRIYLEPLTPEDIGSLREVSSGAGVLLDFAGQAGERLQTELTANGVKLYGNRATVCSWLAAPERLRLVLAQAGLERVAPEQLSAAHRGLVVETIADGETAWVTGIVEQIEEPRINLNDSACSLPPYTLAEELVAQAGAAALQLTRALKVRGLFWARFAVLRNRPAFLEARPGVGQLAALICKATGRPWVAVATRAILGQTLKAQKLAAATRPNFTAVKEAVFPFNRFPSGDPVLGGAVRSSGAALGMAQDFGMAFIKAQLAAGEQMPFLGVVYLKIRSEEQRVFAPLGKELSDLGFALIAPEETAEFLQNQGLQCRAVNHVGAGRPDILDWIKNGKVHWIIGTAAPDRDHEEAILVRRTAVARGIPITTTLAGALAAVRGMRQYLAAGPVVKALPDYTYFTSINNNEGERWYQDETIGAERIH
jgi:carbamoyl-phosphate synthase large subunit